MRYPHSQWQLGTHPLPCLLHTHLSPGMGEQESQLARPGTPLTKRPRVSVAAFWKGSFILLHLGHPSHRQEETSRLWRALGFEDLPLPDTCPATSRRTGCLRYGDTERTGGRSPMPQRAKCPGMRDWLRSHSQRRHNAEPEKAEMILG